MEQINLKKFNNCWYNSGRNPAYKVLWYYANLTLLQNRFNPSSKLRATLLRLFGSKVGKGVVFKPNINIKYPWNVEIGNYSWVGEKTWMDSLAPIKIGKNVCISQGAYLCTGNHDWTDPSFGLIIKPIIIEDGVWVGAQAVILPGVILGTHSVVTAGSVISQNTRPYFIYSGNPAMKMKERKIK